VAHQSFQGVRRFCLTPFFFLARRGRIFEHRGESIDRFSVRPWDQVPIGVHGDLDGAMSELLLNVDRGFAVPEEPGKKAKDYFMH
jgi:hypothetical protein